jgi:hypothetical protein
MSGELLAAWRDRTVQCLLHEDLEEVGRYQGVANGSPGEIRIFKSNLAFLPQAGMPIQWRLAEVESIVFDGATYTITLTGGADRRVLSKLAKKTDEVLGRLQEVHAALREHAATALHVTFPFLSADQLVRLQRLMPEGRSASLAAMDQIHPELAASLIARAVPSVRAPPTNPRWRDSSSSARMKRNRRTRLRLLPRKSRSLSSSGSSSRCRTTWSPERRQPAAAAPPTSSAAVRRMSPRLREVWLW